MPTVVQNLTTLAAAFGVTADPGKAMFRLIDFGADLPRLAGTSVLSVLHRVAVAVAGSISIPLAANSAITPPATAYEVTLLSAVGGWVACGKVHVLSNGTLEVL